ncbi:MAG: NAD-dependent deacylase [Candidatus Cloacimonetes bacterium]|nr:NAD-dependent deacylase [Candidatus Cloacimonadota bacterium]
MSVVTKYRFSSNNRVAILTGAGISAESGIKTFRDADGLWENHRVEDVATPEAFIRDPELVWKFYRARHEQALTVTPNAGHHALKDLEDFLGDNFLLITQNIDGLHTVAGSQRVVEMHGSIHRTFCVDCGISVSSLEALKQESIPKCRGCNSMLRPDVVWFGEVPYHLETIIRWLRDLDFFITVGTSGVVYPAAQFLMTAKYAGTTTIGINLDPPENLRFIDEFHQGLSSKLLPELVKQWIG